MGDAGGHVIRRKHATRERCWWSREQEEAGYPWEVLVRVIRRRQATRGRCWWSRDARSR